MSNEFCNCCGEKLEWSDAQQKHTKHKIKYCLSVLHQRMLELEYFQEHILESNRNKE